MINNIDHIVHYFILYLYQNMADIKIVSFAVNRFRRQ